MEKLMLLLDLVVKVAEFVYADQVKRIAKFNPTRVSSMMGISELVLIHDQTLSLIHICALLPPSGCRPKRCRKIRTSSIWSTL